MPLTSLVGREEELATAGDLLRQLDLRLLTLTGAGGTGKTRLALALASQAEGAFPDGVVWVPLAAVRDVDAVLLAITGAPDIGDLGGRSPFEAARRAMHAAEMLLVLDNLEQVLDAAPRLAALLEACPSLTILATSRERLLIGGEVVFPIGPLSLRDPAGDAGAGTGVASAAVRLFVERARALAPGFALDETTAPAIAEIVRRLDGLPLAIELAASRLGHLSLGTLAERIEHRLPLLTGGARDLPHRLRTMRDAIAWSHDLLSPAEQAAFRRLSVFVGGFALAAAEWVIGDEEGVSAVDLLGSLVEKSLVWRDRVDGSRYHMLETIREYAAEQLAAGGAEGAARRHAEYYDQVALRSVSAISSESADGAVSRVDLGNVRAALAWAVDRDAADLALRLSTAMLPLWQVDGQEREGLAWLRRALAAGGSPGARARALVAAAWLAQVLRDYGASAAFAADGLALARRHGDEVGIARGILALGLCAFCGGRGEVAEGLLTDALSRCRALDDRDGAATALCYLASLDSLQAVDEGGDPAALARAAAFCEEALRLFEEIGQSRGILRARHGLAYATYKQRDFRRSLGLLREVLAVLHDQGWPIFAHLEDIADIAGRAGVSEQAARLYGAADALREAFEQPVEPAYREEFDRDVAVARRALDEAAFAAAWAAGRALTEAEAAAEALAFSLPPGGDPAGLTPRQLDVLRLLATGQSNREIAAELYIGERTVESHVSKIFARLHMRDRAAAVAAATAAGLLDPPPSLPPAA